MDTLIKFAEEWKRQSHKEAYDKQVIKEAGPKASANWQELLNNHIGQAPFKTIAAIHIKKIQNRGGTFPHTVFFGGPGLGKTTLAKLIAKCLGTRFREFIAEDLKAKKIHELIEETRYLDIIFIDEIHSIDVSAGEILYAAVQDFEYEGRKIPAVTLIGATTDAGDVPKPLLDRFPYRYSMQPYSLEELTRIVLFHYPELSQEEALECSKRSLDTPRVAKNLGMHVDAARGICSAEEIFNYLGVDDTGLQPEHCQVLNTLFVHAKPMAFQELVFRTNIPRTDLLNFYERHLLQRGYVTRTTRGRIITPEGVDYLKERQDGAHGH